MKSDTIQFGNFSVPLQEFASQGNAILGIRDSGKSYTATLLTRERKKTKAVGFPDMLACAKVLRVVPPSLGRASTNRGSFWSYGPSRGRNRLPGGQDVFGCVFVTVMLRRTLWTLPAPHIQRQFFQYVAAATASLRRRKKPVDLDHGSSVLLGFVGELPGDLMPTTVANGFSKATVGHHVAHRQILKVNRLVLANDLSGCFMRKIFPGIVNLCVKLGDFLLRLFPIGRSFLFIGKTALQKRKPVFIFCGVSRIANSRPVRKGHRAVNTKVHAHASGGLRLFFNRFIQAKRNEVSARPVPTQRHRGGFRGEVSAPLHLEPPHFGNRQALIGSIPLETGSSVLGRLLLIFALECGVLGCLHEEIGKRSLEMSKGLLNRNARYLVKPLGFFGFFKFGQRGAGLAVVDPFALVPGVGSQPKSPIVDVPYATERLSQDSFLFSCRVNAKTVTAKHALHISIVICKINSKPFRGILPAAGFPAAFPMNQRFCYLLVLILFLCAGGRGAIAGNPGTTKPAAVPTAGTAGSARSAGGATSATSPTPAEKPNILNGSIEQPFRLRWGESK